MKLNKIGLFIHSFKRFCSNIDIKSTPVEELRKLLINQEKFISHIEELRNCPIKRRLFRESYPLLELNEKFKSTEMLYSKDRFVFTVYKDIIELLKNKGY